MNPPNRHRPGALRRVPFLPVLLAALLTGSVAVAQSAAGDEAVFEGRFMDAVVAYEQALRSRPNDATVRATLARTLVYHADDLPEDDPDRRGLYERALEEAENAAELAPDDPDVLFEVARAIGRTAQYHGVLASLNLAARMADTLDRVLELDPDHAAAWHARALYHHEVPWIAGGRAGQIAPAFERAIAQEPDTIAHRLAFAEVLIARGNEEAAREHLAVALELPAESYLQRRDQERARALWADLP